MRNIALAITFTSCLFLGAAVYLQATSKMVINTGGIIVAGKDDQLAEGGLDALLRHYADNER